MVRPFVVHELVQSLAWVITAKAAEIHRLVSHALPELAFIYPVINIIASTTIAVRRSAGAAIKAARAVW